MNYEQIKKLMDDMGNSKLSEIEIEFPDGVKISMKKGLSSSKPTLRDDYSIIKKENSEIQNVQNNFEEQEINDKSKILVENNLESNVNKKIIKAPMVGTFYSKISPTDEPYVKIGKKINKGEIVCIIEAMKLMNEIESDIEGEIIEVFCQDGDMVEYGQPLFKLK